MNFSKPLVLFDGVCNFCNGLVNFLIRHDKKKKLIFSPLQSATGKKILEEFNMSGRENDTFILYINGKIYTRSTAALKLYGFLPWYWKWTQLFWIFPVFIRDAVYDRIARNRYKWFGKRNECMVPAPGIGDRFV